MVAGVEDIFYWREQERISREYRRGLLLYTQSLHTLPVPEGYMRVYPEPAQLTVAVVEEYRGGSLWHFPLTAMAASGGDCQKCGQPTHHRYFYGSIAVCGECYRNAIGAEPPVPQSQRAIDNESGEEHKPKEVYPRPIPKSNIEDADEISKRIREIAAEENRQPTIDRISPPKDPPAPQESPES